MKFGYDPDVSPEDLDGAGAREFCDYLTTTYGKDPFPDYQVCPEGHKGLGWDVSRLGAFSRDISGDRAIGGNGSPFAWAQDVKLRIEMAAGMERDLEIYSALSDAGEHEIPDEATAALAGAMQSVQYGRFCELEPEKAKLDLEDKITELTSGGGEFLISDIQSTREELERIRDNELAAEAEAIRDMESIGAQMPQYRYSAYADDLRLADAGLDVKAQRDLVCCNFSGYFYTDAAMFAYMKSTERMPEGSNGIYLGINWDAKAPDALCTAYETAMSSRRKNADLGFDGFMKSCLGKRVGSKSYQEMVPAGQSKGLMPPWEFKDYARGLARRAESLERDLRQWQGGMCKIQDSRHKNAADLLATRAIDVLYGPAYAKYPELLVNSPRAGKPGGPMDYNTIFSAIDSGHAGDIITQVQSVARKTGAMIRAEDAGLRFVRESLPNDAGLVFSTKAEISRMRQDLNSIGRTGEPRVARTHRFACRQMEDAYLNYNFRQAADMQALKRESKGAKWIRPGFDMGWPMAPACGPGDDETKIRCAADGYWRIERVMKLASGQPERVPDWGRFMSGKISDLKSKVQRAGSQAQEPVARNTSDPVFDRVAESIENTAGAEADKSRDRDAGED